MSGAHDGNSDHPEQSPSSDHAEKLQSASEHVESAVGETISELKHETRDKVKKAGFFRRFYDYVFKGKKSQQTFGSTISHGEQKLLQLENTEELEKCLSRLEHEVAEKIHVANPEIIHEKAIFPQEKDVLSLMIPYAKSEFEKLMHPEKLKFDDLKVSNVVKDKEGNLLALYLKFPTREGEYMQMEYLLGVRCTEANFKAVSTTLTVAEYKHNDQEKDESLNVIHGKTLLDYKNGKWVSVC